MIDPARSFSAFYRDVLGLEVADAPLGDKERGVPSGLELRLGARRVLIRRAT